MQQERFGLKASDFRGSLGSCALFLQQVQRQLLCWEGVPVTLKLLVATNRTFSWLELSA